MQTLGVQKVMRSLSHFNHFKAGLRVAKCKSSQSDQGQKAWSMLKEMNCKKEANIFTKGLTMFSVQFAMLLTYIDYVARNAQDGIMIQMTMTISSRILSVAWDVVLKWAEK